MSREVPRKRHPSIGRAFLAYYAIERGDEPTSCVADFLEDAQRRLGALLAEQRDKPLGREDRRLLADLHLVLVALAGAAEARPGFAKKILWRNRTRGQPTDKLERAKAEYTAVAIVERLMEEEGWQEEQSVQQAVIDTGVSRAEIFARWKYVKAMRDPQQHELMIANFNPPAGLRELLRPWREKKSSNCED